MKPSKFYATDLGLRHSQIGFRDGDISGIMENLVYVELRRRGDSIEGIGVSSLADFLCDR